MLQLTVTHFGFSPVKGARHSAHPRAEQDPSGIVFNRRWGLVLPETGKVLRTVAYPKLVQVENSLSGYGNNTQLHLEIPGRGSFTLETLSKEETQTFDFWGQPKRLALYDHTVNAAFSDFLGQQVVLAYAFDPLIFGAPLSLIGSATLEEIGRRVAAPHNPEAGLVRVDAARLRCNLVVQTDEPFIEDTWAGQQLQLQVVAGLEGKPVHSELDGVLITLGKPIGRCAVIDTNPVTGVRDLKLLKSLANYRPRNQRGEPVAGVYASFSALSDMATPGGRG